MTLVGQLAMTSSLFPGSQIIDQTLFILCKYSARSLLQQLLDPPPITTLEYNNLTKLLSAFVCSSLKTFIINKSTRALVRSSLLSDCSPILDYSLPILDYSSQDVLHLVCFRLIDWFSIVSTTRN
ncbi:hypothetical protein PGTUg99_020425 [Puccinia graminis f. sp. tritici]|uniref:Uncharacterized protein n=1 Tax=Puccinia graminis f. sp. tritici TaxID=56615 RepID=A0A5B0MYF7_PUCGR|nr:hypothetical protein PGTUg99_020425 [Puccinia graminis f. sp. tritici]